MKYRIEITGGYANISNVLEGELTDTNNLLQRALLSEKNMVKINPRLRDGYVYKITLDKGRKGKQEFLFDETNLPNSVKQLLDIAHRRKVA